MQNKIIPALIAVVVSMLMILNQNNIVKAWEMASNYARGFIAVPADGSQWFNTNNLVWLDHSGKIPATVLPALAWWWWGGLFFSCWPCPNWFTFVWDLWSATLSAYSDIPRIYNRDYNCGDQDINYSRYANASYTSRQTNTCKCSGNRAYSVWKLCR